MATDRRRMTARVVPLRSREASEAQVAGNAAERIALVVQLSAALWERTQLPLPSYSRATMPIQVITRTRAPDGG